MLIGYARVSTLEQNPRPQIDALVAAGVDPERVYLDFVSGTRASRPEWDKARSALRDGDTLVCTRLDRLARSLKHLVNLSDELRRNNVELKVTEQGVDTSTPEGRAMFGMLAVMAEFQRDLIVANTTDGLASARARGRVGGRKPKLTPAQVDMAQQMYDQREKTVAQIAELLGVKRTTVYNHLTLTTGKERRRE